MTDKEISERTLADLGATTPEAVVAQFESVRQRFDSDLIRDANPQNWPLSCPLDWPEIG